jgi:hypothetical protein
MTVDSRIASVQFPLFPMRQVPLVGYDVLDIEAIHSAAKAISVHNSRFSICFPPCTWYLFHHSVGVPMNQWRLRMLMRESPDCDRLACTSLYTSQSDKHLVFCRHYFAITFRGTFCSVDGQ